MEEVKPLVRKKQKEELNQKRKVSKEVLSENKELLLRLKCKGGRWVSIQQNLNNRHAVRGGDGTEIKKQNNRIMRGV